MFTRHVNRRINFSDPTDPYQYMMIRHMMGQMANKMQTLIQKIFCDKCNITFFEMVKGVETKWQKAPPPRKCARSPNKREYLSTKSTIPPSSSSHYKKPSFFKKQEVKIKSTSTAENRCYKCHGKGHLTKVCHKKQLN
jgi:hypothetical protein